MLVSELLDQVHQVGVLHLLRREDVPLVQLLHGPGPVDNNMSTFPTDGEEDTEQKPSTRGHVSEDDPIRTPSEAAAGSGNLPDDTLQKPRELPPWTKQM